MFTRFFLAKLTFRIITRYWTVNNITVPCPICIAVSMAFFIQQIENQAGLGIKVIFINRFLTLATGKT